MKNCYFHHDKEATHTDSIVDLDRGGIHEICYKRVPICASCARLRKFVNTSRVEELEIANSGAAGGNRQEPQK